MPQPSDVRLVTEARHLHDYRVTTGRLAAVENAAGFSEPPLGFEDAIVSGLVSSSTDTRSALDQRYSPVAGGRPVGKGELAISASDYGAIGNGVNESAAWTAAINAAYAQGGGVVTALRGRTYVVENLPLLPNVYIDLTGIKLKLPATPQYAMFVAPALERFQGGGVLNGELDGGNKSQHCFDFTDVDVLDQYIIDASYIHHFDRGYTGSKNDRWPLFRGIRFWDNNVGMYIVTNHPIIHFCDFRFNDVGLTGHINDLYVIGTKFNFNRVGTQPAEGGVIINSRFTGCMWFRNTESGLTITSRTYVGGGGMFVGQNTAGGDVGLTIRGVGNMVEGMQFGYEVADHCFSGAAIRFSAAVSECASNVIDGNFFSVLGTGPGIDTNNSSGQSIRANIVSNNTVRLGADRKFLTIPGNFTNNRVTGNSIFLTAAGLADGSGVIEVPSTAASASDFTDNTFVCDSAVAGQALVLGDVTGATITGNRFRNFAKPVTVGFNSPGATWGQNNGFQTAAQGEASVLQGTTYITVTHGLKLTPQRHQIQVTPTNSLGSATKFWISDVTETDFRINTNVDPASSTARFAWRADMSL